MFWVLICTVHLGVCPCHVRYTFQTESTFYSCLNVKEILPQSTSKLSRLSDCNWGWTLNHLVLKWTVNHLGKLAKYMSCVLSTYLHGAFDCMLLSRHVRVSEWIHTLKLSKFEWIPCSKQVQSLKVGWLQLHSNSERLSSYRVWILSETRT